MCAQVACTAHITGGVFQVEIPAAWEVGEHLGVPIPLQRRVRGGYDGLPNTFLPQGKEQCRPEDG